jgi:hypothetical protein
VIEHSEPGFCEAFDLVVHKFFFLCFRIINLHFAFEQRRAGASFISVVFASGKRRFARQDDLRAQETLCSLHQGCRKLL